MTLCVICLNYLDEKLVVGPCGHPFHEKCIFGWIRIKPTCPHCVKKLTPKMLCRLHMEPLRIFQDVVENPDIYKDIPEEIRKQISAPKQPSTAGDGDGGEDTATPGGGTTTTTGGDEKSNEVLVQLRDKLSSQHDELSKCLMELSKLEAFKLSALDTQANLEERVSSLDLMNMQLENSVARNKRKQADLEKENKEMRHLSEVQLSMERCMNGEDFSLTEILNRKSPGEQTALLFPMVHQLREENEKIRRDRIEMENRFDSDSVAQLARAKELQADLKVMQKRLTKSEAKRDRFKERLGKASKKNQLELKQRIKQSNIPPIPSENSAVNITPGVIEPYPTENKTDDQPLCLRKRPFAAPVKGLQSFNPRLTKKAGKRKGSSRRFGFGSSAKPGSKSHSASISSGFDGRGGSSKVVIKKLKRRRLGNSLF